MPRGSPRSRVTLCLLVLRPAKIGPTAPTSAAPRTGRRRPGGCRRAAGSTRGGCTSAPSIAKQAADQRAGPERRQVEDPQPARTAAARRSAATRRRRPGRWPRATWRARPAAAPGSAVARSGRAEPVRAARGSMTPSRGFVTNVPRCREVVGRRDASRRCRSARAGCGRPPRGRGPRRSCARRSTRRWSGVSAVRSRKSFAVLGPLGVLDHHAEVEPLLAGADPEPDEAVAGRLHPGRDDAIARCGTADPPCR